MSTALYLWRAAARRSWRPLVVLVLLGGVLGAVALAAVAGAWRTDTAYGRYLRAANVSDAFVNVPGKLPGMPATRPLTLISHLPGVTASAPYLGLLGAPVIHGHITWSFLAASLNGTLDREWYKQDRLTVLAGRLAPADSVHDVMVTPAIRRLLGAHVGGKITYAFFRAGPNGLPSGRPVIRSYRLTAVVDVPPALVDQADVADGSIFPPAATHQLLASYQYATVGVRLAGGAAGNPGPPAPPGHAGGDAAAAAVPRHPPEAARPVLPGHPAGCHPQPGSAVDPAAGGGADSVPGAITALAILVLVGQSLAQLVSRSQAGPRGPAVARAPACRSGGPDCQPARRGRHRGRRLSPRGGGRDRAVPAGAPVGPVRDFDPARGAQADGAGPRRRVGRHDRRSAGPCWPCWPCGPPAGRRAARPRPGRPSSRRQPRQPASGRPRSWSAAATRSSPAPAVGPSRCGPLSSGR